MNRIADILLHLQNKGKAEKETSGILNPIKFEQDLVSSINGESKLSAYQSAYSKGIAEKCVKSLRAKVGGTVSAYQLTKGTGAGKSVLSPIYKKFMCDEGGKCNGDPKTDLVVFSQMNGKMNISIKKEGAAQIATAQVGETNAVISAALGASKEIPTLVRSILSQTLSKTSYYEIREKYSKMVDGTKDSDSFDSMLSSLVGLKTGDVASPKRLDDFNRFLSTIGIKEKISSSLREYMNSTSVRKKIFKEFASGEKRYIEKESDRSADWFMIWSEQGTVDLQEIDQFVTSHLDSFRMNIRDRGNQSGGSLRIDIKDATEYSELQKILFDEFDKYCLTEGVLETTVDIIKTAGYKVAQLYKIFVEAVKTSLSIIAALFVNGAGVVLDYFDIETTDMSYSW